MKGVTRVDNRITVDPKIDQPKLDAAGEKTKAGLGKAVDATVGAAKKTKTGVQKGAGKTEQGVAKAADVLFHADFEDGDTGAWQIGGAGDARVTLYATNHSLRMLNQAQATTSVNTEGYATASIGAAFAAYRLGRPIDHAVALKRLGAGHAAFSPSVGTARTFCSGGVESPSDSEGTASVAGGRKSAAL